MISHGRGYAAGSGEEVARPSLPATPEQLLECLTEETVERLYLIAGVGELDDDTFRKVVAADLFAAMADSMCRARIRTLSEFRQAVALDPFR